METLIINNDSKDDDNNVRRKLFFTPRYLIKDRGDGCTGDSYQHIGIDVNVRRKRERRSRTRKGGSEIKEKGNGTDQRSWVTVDTCETS